MRVKACATANCDDVVVFWRIEAAITGCWGFALEREQRTPGGAIVRQVLDNRIGFARDQARSGDTRPSTEWPFQLFTWADHSANTGDRLRYRVVPMIHDGARLNQAISQRSAWTPWLSVSSRAGTGTSASFNRGLVISQFMARYLERLRVDEGLATLKDALKRFKGTIGQHELPIRNFLSGVLRTEMLALLENARKKRHHVFAALYEINDDELINALGALGPRAHVVLANGSITKRKGETTAEAQTRDENEDARRTLEALHVEVFGRMTAPGALAHNKFLVVTSATKRPLAVWTGSTNWTSTGLCTQTNNGLLISDATAAGEYLRQWERLRDAGSDFPPALVSANAVPKTVRLGKSSADIWFSRTPKKVDLAAIDAVVNGATEGILFLMFQPGGTATLGSIRTRMATPGPLYVKGVVSTLPAETTATESEVKVATVGDAVRRRLDLDVVQPEGIKTPFASWAATATRGDFITGQGGVVGYAIVHSKVIVADPFTNPVVITGSHNFSASASSKNDENFVIVRGNRTLALEYAVHILGVYKHYRWLAYVNAQQRSRGNPVGTLAETDAWQARHLKGAPLRELEFWVR